MFYFRYSFDICSVLTDAPLMSVLSSFSTSRCGVSNVCVYICKVNAIQDKSWETGVSRDEMVNVFLCNTCLKCIVICPWTQQYINRELNEKVD